LTIYALCGEASDHPRIQNNWPEGTRLSAEVNPRDSLVYPAYKDRATA
jgi:hypothetical protein